MLGTLHTFYLDYADYLGSILGRFKPFLKKYESAFFNRCLLITSPSQALGSELRKRKVFRPIVQLPNPVEIEPFFDARKFRDEARKELALKGHTLIYLGRLGYEKNLDTLIALVAPILRGDPSSTFLIAGEGPIQEKLHELVLKLSLGKQVSFLGYVRGKELKKALAAADIFVTASLTENQPLSIIEAQAAGLPVVAYATRGIPELVMHNSTGKMIKEGDEDSFRAAIERLFNYDIERQTFSRRAQEHAKKYSRHAVVAELSKLYDDLASSKYV